MNFDTFMNKWYSDILGVDIDTSKMSWQQRQRLDKLVERQLELHNIEAKNNFEKLSPQEQNRRSLENRLLELAFEPTLGKPLRDVDNKTLEKVLNRLKKAIEHIESNRK